MDSKFVRFCFFIIFVCGVCAFGASLQEKVNKIVYRKDQLKVAYSVLVVDAETGEVACEFRRGRSLIPASNMKLVTTAAALEYLGSDFKYETKLGLADNTLVIKGSGDPLLGDKITNAAKGRAADWPLSDMVKQLKDKQLAVIDGVVVDTFVFDDKRVHPSWPVEQLNRWYACEVSGLNYNLNCVDITAKASNGRVSINCEPATSYVKIANKAKAVSKGKSTIGAYRTNVANQIILKGKVRKKAGPFQVAIESPAMFASYLLAEKLIANDVTIIGEIVEGPSPKGCKQIFSYDNSLADVILRCNRDSLGLATECLVKTIAAGSEKKNGSWERGAEILKGYLKMLGVSESEFNIDDGSGLSRDNRLSANALVAVLKRIYSKPEHWEIMKNSLSVGGVSGTAAKWFKEKKYRGKIFVKTGYISGVRSYSGVCRAGGKDYLFSIITNKSNGKSRKAMNQMLMAIVDSL